MKHAIQPRANLRACITLLAFAAVAVLGAGCASLPSLDQRVSTTVIADTADTRLARAISPSAVTHASLTGVRALPDAREAFATRMLLAAAADKSIDAQYYIWRGDEVGYLLLEALWNAAERGVRVRLLLDDVGTSKLDATIAALDAHPNIEVRLYNPFAQRTARALTLLTDFDRLNRRMHNKSFTVDSQATIVGGRNIGNEYFAADAGVLFADLDVVAVGSVVRDVSSQFDLFWNSAASYPAAMLLGTVDPQAAANLKGHFAATRAHPEYTHYMEAVSATPIVRDLLENKIELEWSTVRLLFDDPAKTFDEGTRADMLLLPQLLSSMGPARAELDIVSPYLVPGEQGTAALVGAAGHGVRVRILSNSLSSNDASAVHAGYAKRRVDLLRAGIKLYELKATRPRESGEQDGEGITPSGSSALHAKTFAVDGTRVFVGSMNMDPRSARLNTELGMVIDSPALAKRLADVFDQTVPKVAYEVRLMPDGRSLEWIEHAPSGDIRYDSEPNTRWITRAGVAFISILPIDWLL